VNHVVRDGENGLMTAPGDVAALAAALARLRGDAALRRHLGDAGRRRWREEFTLEASVARTISLYESVLAAAERREATAPAG
jgi:glycosyltransferase involved in cell wall biosynthesis